MNKETKKIRMDEIGFGSLKLLQDPSDFCYGVDAVILSDFASQSPRFLTKGSSDTPHIKIIDLGCGNGIIPIILSHKTKNSHITGIEMRKSAYDLAVKNMELNNLEKRIHFINRDILSITELNSAYDIVVTNPPYVAEGSGIVNHKRDSKMTARHETTAKLDDFIKVSAKLLKNKGELYMVHRPSRTVSVINSLTRHNLEAKVIRYVSPKPANPPNIMLIKAIKNGGPEVEIREPLYVRNEDGTYTDELMRIYERI